MIRPRRRSSQEGDQPDSFERAAERLDADRRSRELGEPIPVGPPGLATALPDRRRMRRTLWVVAGALVLLVIGRVATRSPAPALPASCTASRIAVQPTEAPRGGAVRWSATGPSGRAITVTLDGRQVSTPGTVLRGCRAAARFLVPLGPGRREVRLLDTRTGDVRATARLTVTS